MYMIHTEHLRKIANAQNHEMMICKFLNRNCIKIMLIQSLWKCSKRIIINTVLSFRLENDSCGGLASGREIKKLFLGRHNIGLHFSPGIWPEQCFMLERSAKWQGSEGCRAVSYFKSIFDLWSHLVMEKQFSFYSIQVPEIMIPLLYKI